MTSQSERPGLINGCSAGTVHSLHVIRPLSHPCNAYTLLRRKRRDTFESECISLPPLYSSTYDERSKLFRCTIRRKKVGKRRAQGGRVREAITAYKLTPMHIGSALAECDARGELCGRIDTEDASRKIRCEHVAHNDNASTLDARAEPPLPLLGACGPTAAEWGLTGSARPRNLRSAHHWNVTHLSAPTRGLPTRFIPSSNVRDCIETLDCPTFRPCDE